MIGFRLEVYTPEGAIPWQVGSIRAAMYDLADQSHQWLETKNCKDVISKTALRETRPELQDLIQAGHMQCIDPKDGYLSYY